MQDYIKERINRIKKHILEGGKYSELPNADFMLAKSNVNSFNDIWFKKEDK